MDEITIEGIQNVHFGVDSLKHLGKATLACGKRVLLVAEHLETDQGNTVKAVLNSVGIDPFCFNDIRAGVKISVLEDISKIGRAEGIDVVIGLGGMRVLSLAKIAAAMIGSGAALEDALLGNFPHSNCSYIEVPVSCRNHFMLKNACVIDDTTIGRPRFLELPPGLTKAVFIDPEQGLRLSKKYQAMAILDTVLASVEGYLSRKGNFFSDMCCAEAICILHEALFQTDEMQNRILAARGGLLSCMGLAGSSQGIGGILSYMINAAFRVPKSWTAIVLLPYILDMYAARGEEKLYRIGEALGEGRDDLSAAQAVRRILTQFEFPTRLRDFNLGLEELYTICDDAAAFPLNASCGLSLNSNEVCELIKKAF